MVRIWDQRQTLNLAKENPLIVAIDGFFQAEEEILVCEKGEIMEKMKISKKDFFEMYYVIEKVLYIAHRASSREDSDNNAYSLAITFAKEKVVLDILNIRRKMTEYLSEQDRDELEKILDPLDDIKIPYDLSLEELRDELKPFLPKWEKLNGK